MVVGIAVAAAVGPLGHDAPEPEGGFDPAVLAYTLRPLPTPSPEPAPALPRAPVQLPDGVEVIPEPEGFRSSADVLAGDLDLPSGALAIDDFYYGPPQVAVDVAPGRHPFRLTLADSVRFPANRGRVALATLKTRTTRPVTWKRIGIMGTDGGIGGFASAEAARRMASAGDDESDLDGLHDRQLDVLIEAGSNNQVGRLPVGGGLSLFTFDVGLGDGGYAVYTGRDARGRVARVVLDGGLLHLAWPSP